MWVKEKKLLVKTPSRRWKCSKERKLAQHCQWLPGEQSSSARLEHQVHEEQYNIQKGRSGLDGRGPLFQTKNFFPYKLEFLVRVLSTKQCLKGIELDE